MKIPEKIKIAGYTYKIERPAEPFESNIKKIYATQKKLFIILKKII